VDVELAVCRHVFNVTEEWKHRPKGSNPFAGRGKATGGGRRQRAKEQEREAKPEYYTLEQIRALLDQADREAGEAGEKSAWRKHRLRALVYFMAYTGARVREVLHLEWTEIDWGAGVAWLHFKIENDLKTDGSAAPFGLPNALMCVLCEWESKKTCKWVFPNGAGNPWVTSGPGYKPLDLFKSLAKRAGIDHATWKMFRHSFDTHGKGRFGMSKAQMQAQLRHTTEYTQKHYDHDDLANLRDAVKGIDFRK
jgi:integrase